jgi:hypothetical protein
MMTSHSEDDVTHPLLHKRVDEPKTDDPRYPESIRDEELKAQKTALPEPAFDDVMIDIETMSLHPHKALILSIGMIEFDASGFQEGPGVADLRIGRRELIVLDPAPQLLALRHVDLGTQEFWSKQPAEASHHWTYPKTGRVHPQWAMCQVKEFCFARKRVWANGTQFDLSNLVALGEEYGVRDLWHYQAPRDMRTFVAETPANRLVNIGQALDIPGVAHEPVYDCISQAWRVWAHWQGH